MKVTLILKNTNCVVTIAGYPLTILISLFMIIMETFSWSLLSFPLNLLQELIRFTYPSKDMKERHRAAAASSICLSVFASVALAIKEITFLSPPHDNRVSFDSTLRSTIWKIREILAQTA